MTTHHVALFIVLIPIVAALAKKLYHVWRVLLFEHACAECGRSVGRHNFCVVHGFVPKVWKRTWYAHEFIIMLAAVGVCWLSKFITRAESPRE